MTLDQKRDRLAELLGWKKLDTWFKCNEPWIPIGEGHPIPTTIDGIAALMPVDWWITVSNCDNTQLPGPWHARGGSSTHFIPWQMGYTEYEARLTLLLAVLEAKGKK